MKLRYLAALTVTGAVLLCAGSAMAARQSFPSTITHDGSVAVGAGGTFVSSGHVSSPRLQCRALRLVKLIGHYPSGRTELLDLDLTSVMGAWAAKADLTNTDRLKVRVAKYTYGGRGNRKVCQPDSVVFPSPTQ